MMYHHVVCITRVQWIELLEKKEENGLISVSVYLCGCITVYTNCDIKNFAEMSHMILQSGQGGC